MQGTDSFSRITLLHDTVWKWSCLIEFRQCGARHSMTSLSFVNKVKVRSRTSCRSRQDIPISFGPFHSCVNAKTLPRYVHPRKIAGE